MGVVKSLQSKTNHCQLAGTSACARVAHGKRSLSELGLRGPAILGEAGAGLQRRERLARAGRSGEKAARRGCSGGRERREESAAQSGEERQRGEAARKGCKKWS